MSTHIKPTIGRVVWFHPGDNDGDSYGSTWPASVCHVWSDALINVGGFDSDGRPFKATSVLLLQDGEQRPRDGRQWCEWMPYQKGQAAKTEALEKQQGG